MFGNVAWAVLSSAVAHVSSAKRCTRTGCVCVRRERAATDGKAGNGRNKHTTAYACTRWRRRPRTDRCCSPGSAMHRQSWCSQRRMCPPHWPCCCQTAGTTRCRCRSGCRCRLQRQRPQGEQRRAGTTTTSTPGNVSKVRPHPHLHEARGCRHVRVHGVPVGTSQMPSLEQTRVI